MERPKPDAAQITKPALHFFLAKVSQLNSGGAYVEPMDQNMPPSLSRKEFLLPNSEMSEQIERNDEILVCAELESDSDLVSMKIEKNLLEKNQGLTDGEKVQLIIYRKTDLGFKAIVNQRFTGIIYSDQVFKNLYYGQSLEGYILKIRDDHRIDLTLQKIGHRAAEGIEPVLMKMLEENNGFLDINEKTPPERVYKLFGVSKKKFKMVLGGLYKKRLISIDEDGIRKSAGDHPRPPTKK